MKKRHTDFRLSIIKVLLDLSQVLVADRRILQCGSHGSSCEGVFLNHLRQQGKRKHGRAEFVGALEK
jgi:hypothetical protein